MRKILAIGLMVCGCTKERSLTKKPLGEVIRSSIESVKSHDEKDRSQMGLSKQKLRVSAESSIEITRQVPKWDDEKTSVAADGPDTDKAWQQQQEDIARADRAEELPLSAQHTRPGCKGIVHDVVLDVLGLGWQDGVSREVKFGDRRFCEVILEPRKCPGNASYLLVEKYEEVEHRIFELEKGFYDDFEINVDAKLIAALNPKGAADNCLSEAKSGQDFSRRRYHSVSLAEAPYSVVATIVFYDEGGGLEQYVFQSSRKPKQKLKDGKSKMLYHATHPLGCPLAKVSVSGDSIEVSAESCAKVRIRAN